MFKPAIPPKKTNNGDDQSGSRGPSRPPQILKNRQLLHEVVREEIKAYIIQNNLTSGDPLPTEQELSRRFDVSRTSVREAVKSLAALGILEARAGSGLFVQNFSMEQLLDNFAFDLMFNAKELADLFEIRFHIEFGMISRAVRAVSPSQIERLEEILERMRLSADQGINSGEEDREFHMALWQNVKNQALIKILGVSFLVRKKTLEAIKAKNLFDPVFIYQRHLRIMEALKHRDIQAMRANIIRHYTTMDAVNQDGINAMDADLIRHYIDLEMCLQLPESIQSDGASK